MNTTARTLEKRLEIHPRQAVPVNTVPGTVVHCESGLIWLTQEALWSDTILVAGTKFVSASDGKIVLSAPDGAVARIYASGSDGRGRLASGLHIDHEVIVRIERDARLARWVEIGRGLRWLGSFIASAWHNLTHRQHHAVAGK